MSAPPMATLLRKGTTCRVCGLQIMRGSRVYGHTTDNVGHSHCGYWLDAELSAGELAALGALDRRETVFSTETWKALLSLWQKGLIRIVDKDKPTERYLLTLLALPVLERLRASRSAQAATPSTPPGRLRRDGVAASAERVAR